jgi:hypothetical protein
VHAQARRAGTQALRLVSGSRTSLAVDLQAVGVEPVFEAIAETDEGIAREALATFDALEQEARPERLQLQVRRHRCVEVGGYVEQRRRHLRVLWRGT